MDKLLLLAQVLKEMLSWKSALDIFLIAALIFLIYRTFRSLGTWRVLLGIIIAMTVFVIASLLELQGIGWIYTNLSQVAVLGVIVIFQPEIRKVFERAVSFRRNAAESSEPDLSLMVGEALFALAQQKQGAIIVFPGKETVKPWLAGGFLLDAEPSLPLIMSIFDPNSAGHDGALIVENGRFTMFGVRLPISKTGNLPREFGTRHQAAMGLSEMTDALVVVVSEERGTITTFLKGTLRSVEDATKLCSKIKSHWENTSSYIPKVSLKRYKWKILPDVGFVTLLAFIFWAILAISHARIFERSFILPVEYVSLPQNLALVGNKPTEIRVHLAGPKQDLEAFGASRSMVKIDLSSAMAGKQTLAVSEESMQLPKKIRILEMAPSSLSISLEEIMYKELIVKPQLVGRLPGNLTIVSITVTPNKVKTSYPSGIGKQGDMSLMTTPIYLESIQEDATLFCKIIGPADVQPVDKRWPDVQVKIKVRPKAKE